MNDLPEIKRIYKIALVIKSSKKTRHVINRLKTNQKYMSNIHPFLPSSTNINYLISNKRTPQNAAAQYLDYICIKSVVEGKEREGRKRERKK